MKVAIISSAQDVLFPVAHNGVAHWSQQVAQRLGALVNSAEFEITLIGRGRSAQNKTSFCENGVSYRLIRPHGSTLGYALTTARVARRLRADIVHIHEDVNLIKTIRLLNPRASIVLHTQSTTLATRSTVRHMRQCRLVIASSRELRNLIRAAHPQFADRVTAVHNGVDTTLFRPAPGAVSASGPSVAPMRGRLTAPAIPIDETMFSTIVPTPSSRAALESQKILYVGDFSAENGVHDLIDAFSQIAAHVPQATLELIGSRTDQSDYDGNYLAQLKARIPKHLVKRIYFRDPLPKAKLLDALQTCALVVHPGHGSGYNMSIAQAGACGKPTVTTNAYMNAGIVVDGETGFTIEPGDVHMLAQGLGILLHDLTEQARMGRNARVRVRYLYDWAEVTKSTLAAYERAAGQAPTARPVGARALS